MGGHGGPVEGEPGEGPGKEKPEEGGAGEGRVSQWGFQGSACSPHLADKPHVEQRKEDGTEAGKERVARAASLLGGRQRLSRAGRDQQTWAKAGGFVGRNAEEIGRKA